MVPVNYRVSEPQSVRQAFREILDRSEQDNQLAIVLRAARYMMEELAYDPMRCGESRGFLDGAQIWLRLAFTPPLSVWFGVHESSKQVFIFRIGIR